jgi:hypothetical protein
MTPTLNQNPDTRTAALSLALLLTDAFTGLPELTGNIQIDAPGGEVPYRKDSASAFLFFHLPAGSPILKVSSTELRPYYSTVSIPVDIPPPNPKWPAFPDATLSDAKKYQAQLALAALKPTTGYPFPANASLVRGHILTGGKPVLGALVQAPGAGLSYTTANDGEYVLFFVQVTGASQTITVSATAPGGVPVKTAVLVQRGVAVTQDINV